MSSLPHPPQGPLAAGRARRGRQLRQVRVREGVLGAFRPGCVFLLWLETHFASGPQGAPGLHQTPAGLCRGGGDRDPRRSEVSPAHWSGRAVTGTLHPPGPGRSELAALGLGWRPAAPVPAAPLAQRPFTWQEAGGHMPSSPRSGPNAFQGSRQWQLSWEIRHFQPQGPRGQGWGDPRPHLSWGPRALSHPACPVLVLPPPHTPRSSAKRSPWVTAQAPRTT